MIRRITLFVALLFACAFSGYSADIYLRGEVNSWNAEDGWKFAEEGNGVYTLDLSGKSDLSGAFKIADANWSEVNYGGTGTLGIYYDFSLQKGGENIYFNSEITYSKLTLTIGESATLRAEGKYAVPEKLYMIGSVNGMVWNPTVGTELTLDAETGIFSGELYATADEAEFAFTTTLGADENDWATMNASRFGAPDNSTYVLAGREYGVSQNDQNNFKLNYTDTYVVSVNMAKRSVALRLKNAPEQLWLIGNIAGKGFSDLIVEGNNSYELTKADNAPVFSIENVEVSEASEGDGYGYLAFVSNLAAFDTEWDYVNNYRYGPAVANAEITVGEAAAIGNNGDKSYRLAAGVYDFTVDFENNTVLVETTSSGVDAISGNAEAAKVVASDGLISIVGASSAVSVYTAAGSAVAVGSHASEFSVEPGLYIVVVDGKAIKVLVR